MNIFQLQQAIQNCKESRLRASISGDASGDFLDEMLLTHYQKELDEKIAALPSKPLTDYVDRR